MNTRWPRERVAPLDNTRVRRRVIWRNERDNRDGKSYDNLPVLKVRELEL